MHRRLGVDKNNTMFEIAQFDLNYLIKSCQQDFGLTPRPYGAPIEFGGHVISSLNLTNNNSLPLLSVIDL